jgi:hypothetical protein
LAARHFEMNPVTINFVFVDGELGSMTVPDYVWSDFLMGIAKDARCFRSATQGDGDRRARPEETIQEESRAVENDPSTAT